MTRVSDVLLSILFVILLGSVLLLVVGAASGRLPGQSPSPVSWPSFDGDRVEVTP